MSFGSMFGHVGSTCGKKQLEKQYEGLPNKRHAVEYTLYQAVAPAAGPEVAPAVQMKATGGVSHGFRQTSEALLVSVDLKVMVMEMVAQKRRGESVAEVVDTSIEPLLWLMGRCCYDEE